MRWLIVFLLFPLVSLGLEPGDPAPVFTAKNQDGEAWKSADVVGKKNVVVYFYPAAMTGGCTKQACAYRDSFDKLEASETVVVGVSGDEFGNLALFAKQEKLNFPLLADPDGSIAKAFGVPTRDGGTIQREVDGKQHDLKRGNTASRWTFVIGKDGKVLDVAKKVKAPGDAARVLELLAK